MDSNDAVGLQQQRLIALKDTNFRYRICTPGYAAALGLSAAPAAVDRSDFDLLSKAVARQLRAVDEHVFSTGLPSVVAASLLPGTSDQQHLVTRPIVNSQARLAGIEAQIVSTVQLPVALKTLFQDVSHYKHLVNDAPFGVLVHDELSVCFVNAAWLSLHKLSGVKDNADRISGFLQQWRGKSDQPIRYRANDIGVDVADEFETAEVESIARSIRWHGRAVDAIYSVPACVTASASVNVPIGQSQPSFVEKRRGPRRHRAEQKSDLRQESSAIDETLFNSMPNPVLVCLEWEPLYMNKSATALLASGDGSLTGMFNDRNRALIQARHEHRQGNDTPLQIDCTVNSQPYSVVLSVIDWGGRMATLISFQPLRNGVLDAGEMQQSIRRLDDFNAAAADFLWELDSDFSLSYFHSIVDSGFDGGLLLHQNIEEIADGAASLQDQQEWEELLAQLHRHQAVRDLQLKWQKGTDGDTVLRLAAVPVFDANGTFTGFRGTGRDITRDYRQTVEVAYHASHDALTGLVNRREFETRCDFVVRTAQDGRSTHGLCFLDLDNFKIVNDTCGHLAGDELLRQLAEMFTGLVRKSDVLARLGGDEFGVLIFDVGLNEALRLANQIRSEVENFQFLWEGNRFTVGVSIGLVIIDQQWESRSALFGAADSACYDAKNQGRNRVAVHQSDLAAEDIRAAERPWVDIIQSALQENRLRLCMQEVRSLEADAKPGSHVELLLRILTPDNELVSPHSFMPAAERYGLSTRLDAAVVDFAMQWLASQPHLLDGLQMCALNLGGLSVADEQFTNELMAKLENAPIDVSKLCFELTETATIANLTVASRFMRQVGEYGCRFSLDDFGSGLSSFAYLKNLPVSYIKIDGRFVRDILEDPIDFAMVKAINDIGQTLGKQTIAEFVENESVLDKLAEMGVNYAQGFCIGKPELIDYP